MTDLKILQAAFNLILPAKCMVHYGTSFGSILYLEANCDNNGLELDQEPKSVEFKFDKNGKYLTFD